MKITLLAVGKTDVKWVKEGLDIYTSRLGHYAKFSVEEISGIKKTSALSHEQIKEKEGALILKSLKPDDYAVLLDEHGSEMRSVEFAKALEESMARTGKDIVFIIGGAFGFHESVYNRCDGKISLSKMTFPHQMVRVIFAEQLYRSFTILKGEPYHHE
ncbi:MAG: 23S rRNA (pseudouridine(1915)-N(3))-methyltransferase RlmH [Bacteroidales bacterium]|jgi:23S rRNA (pseudouridine1915-N3)-methyltransferase|nr:23S rRNA (pseudouridine(1915)-N(3))-methyltransferase RlmH [Bacteroidales bacterium]MCI1784589.1 23S rRNA (pseudouridine(1915)-N(3))-methyltransferase RlmH [Bacteroidales bacterium]